MVNHPGAATFKIHNYRQDTFVVQLAISFAVPTWRFITCQQTNVQRQIDMPRNDETDGSEVADPLH